MIGLSSDLMSHLHGVRAWLTNQQSFIHYTVQPSILKQSHKLVPMPLRIVHKEKRSLPQQCRGHATSGRLTKFSCVSFVNLPSIHSIVSCGTWVDPGSFHSPRHPERSTIRPRPFPLITLLGSCLTLQQCHLTLRHLMYAISKLLCPFSFTVFFAFPLGAPVAGTPELVSHPVCFWLQQRIPCLLLQTLLDQMLKPFIFIRLAPGMLFLV